MEILIALTSKGLIRVYLLPIVHYIRKKLLQESTIKLSTKNAPLNFMRSCLNQNCIYLNNDVTFGTHSCCDTNVFYMYMYTVIYMNENDKFIDFRLFSDSKSKWPDRFNSIIDSKFGPILHH